MNLKCPNCSHEFELSDDGEFDPAVDCPECGTTVPVGPQSSIDLDFAFDLDDALSGSGVIVETSDVAETEAVEERPPIAMPPPPPEPGDANEPEGDSVVETNSDEPPESAPIAPPPPPPAPKSEDDTSQDDAELAPESGRDDLGSAATVGVDAISLDDKPPSSVQTSASVDFDTDEAQQETSDGGDSSTEESDPNDSGDFGFTGEAEVSQLADLDLSLTGTYHRVGRVLQHSTDVVWTKQKKAKPADPPAADPPAADPPAADPPAADPPAADPPAADPVVVEPSVAPEPVTIEPLPPKSETIQAITDAETIASPVAASEASELDSVVSGVSLNMDSEFDAAFGSVKPSTSEGATASLDLDEFADLLDDSSSSGSDLFDESDNPFSGIHDLGTEAESPDESSYKSDDETMTFFIDAPTVGETGQDEEAAAYDLDLGAAYNLDLPPDNNALPQSSSPEPSKKGKSKKAKSKGPNKRAMAAALGAILLIAGVGVVGEALGNGWFFMGLLDDPAPTERPGEHTPDEPTPPPATESAPGAPVATAAQAPPATPAPSKKLIVSDTSASYIAAFAALEQKLTKDADNAELKDKLLRLQLRYRYRWPGRYERNADLKQKIAAATAPGAQLSPGAKFWNYLGQSVATSDGRAKAKPTVSPDGKSEQKSADSKTVDPTKKAPNAAAAPDPAGAKEAQEQKPNAGKDAVKPGAGNDGGAGGEKPAEATAKDTSTAAEGKPVAKKAEKAKTLDRKEALRQAELALDLMPSGVVEKGRELLYKAILFVEQGKVDNAQSLLIPCIKQRPNDVWALYLRADLLYKAGKLDQSQKVLTHLTNIDSKHFDARLLAIRVAVERKTPEAYARARELAEKLQQDSTAATDPYGIYEANLMRAVVYGLENDYANRLKALEAAAKFDPRDETLLLELAENDLKKGDAKVAVERLKDCAKGVCSSVRYYKTHLKALFVNHQLVEAEALVQKAEKAFPDVPELTFLSGEILEARGKLTLSARKYKEVKKRDPNYLEAYLRLAGINRREKKFDQAIGVLNEASKVFEGTGKESEASLALQQERGELLVKQGRLDQAREVFSKIISTQQSNGVARYRLAKILTALGYPVKAVAHFEKLYAQGWRDPEIHIFFAEALIRSGKPDRAIEELTIFLESNPNSLDGLVKLGHAFVQKQRHEEAMAVLERAVAIDPNYAAAYFYAGMAELGRQRQRAESVERRERDGEVVRPDERPDFSDAIIALTTAAEKDKDSLEYREMLAQALTERGQERDLKAALEQYDSIILDYRKRENLGHPVKRRAEVYYNRGLLASKLGQPRTRVLKNFQDALGLDTGRADYIARYAEELYRLQIRSKVDGNHVLEAKAYFDLVLTKHDPNHIRANYYMGRILLLEWDKQRSRRPGDSLHNKALSHFERLVKHGGAEQFPAALMEIGNMLKDRRMSRLALSYYKQYLQLYRKIHSRDPPNVRYVRDLIRQLR